MYLNVPICQEKYLICIENLRTFEIKKNVFSLIFKSAIIYFLPVMH